jgi:uncharacterized membrane protein YfcA
MTRAGIAFSIIPALGALLFIYPPGALPPDAITAVAAIQACAAAAGLYFWLRDRRKKRDGAAS